MQRQQTKSPHQQRLRPEDFKRGGENSGSTDLPSLSAPILHSKLMHPSTHQLGLVFNKYFFAPNSSKVNTEIKEKCDTCVSLAKLPQKFIHMEPSKMPSQPGSHMNVDILKRAKQNVLVC